MNDTSNDGVTFYVDAKSTELENGVAANPNPPKTNNNLEITSTDNTKMDNADEVGAVMPNCAYSGFLESFFVDSHASCLSVF